MTFDPNNIPLGSFTQEVAQAIADAIANINVSDINAPTVSITSTVGDIDITSNGNLNLTCNVAFTFAAGGNVTFDLGGNFSLIGSGAVNFDTTNGPPNSGARISFLSGESIIFQATQDSTGQIQFQSNHVNLPNLQVFANNAAAIAGGLVAGDLYRTGANPDPVCVVH